jgi:carbonic anhydrase
MRRIGLFAAALVVAITVLHVLSVRGAPPAPSKNVTAEDALRDLMEGNARFAKGEATGPRRSPAEFRAVSEVQSPIAVVVACADSRVAPELLFDSGVGELFVIRVAGNVVDRAGVVVKGSIEYAISELNVPLVVVLGHTNCGAVKAAVKHIEQKDSLPGSINGLVELIKPVVGNIRGRPGETVENATQANVTAGVEKLKNLEPILAPRVKSGSLKIVGGIYDLHAGTVTLLKPESN